VSARTEMVVERAHLHDRRPFEPPADLESELRFVVPGIFAPGHRVATIQGVEVDHVEPGAVVEFRRPGGHFLKQRRVAVGYE